MADKTQRFIATWAEAMSLPQAPATFHREVEPPLMKGRAEQIGARGWTGEDLFHSRPSTLIFC
jgi:hypothetical protein